MIILEVTKSQGFAFSLEGGVVDQIDSPQPF